MATVALDAGSARSSLVHIRVPKFVGREREVATLAHLLSRPPAVVLVEGEAGIGKSRLIHEVLASVADGRRVFIGACVPSRQPHTLAPIVDAVGQMSEPVARLRLSNLAGVLRPLLPEWVDDLPPMPEPVDDPAANRYLVFRAFAELIDRLDLAALIIEDVQWADDATLEFLLFLAATQPVSGCRLSVVVSYRPEEVGDGSPLLHLSSRLPAGITQVRIVVPPLTEPEAAKLMSSLLDGEPVSGTFATCLHARTGGIPLVIEESMRLMGDKPHLVKLECDMLGLELDDLPVPAAVRDSVRRRSHPMSPAAKRVLEAAAVLAEPADERTLAAVAGLPSSTSTRSLGEAQSSGLLREDRHGRMSFRHALIGKAVYEAMPRTKRRYLHRRAAHTLEGIQPPPTMQLARHFREANEVERWCRYAQQAAEQAVAASDHTTAIIVLNELLTHAQLDMETSTRLARALGIAALSRKRVIDGLSAQVVATLQALVEKPALSREVRGDLHSLLGRLLVCEGHFEAGTAHLERAVQLVAHAPCTAVFVMTLLGRPMGSRPSSEHRRWLRRAAKLDVRGMSASDRLILTIDRAMALLHLGEEEGWTVAAQLPMAPSGDEARRLIVGGQVGIADAAIFWGRYSYARQRADAAVDLGAATGETKMHRVGRILQAHIDWLTAAWDGLPERFAALLAEGDDHPPSWLRAFATAGVLHAAQGGRGKAEEHLGEAVEVARRAGARDEALAPAAWLARLHLEAGDVAGALRTTQEWMHAILEKRIWIWATDLLPVHVELLITTGSADEAAKLVSVFARGLRGRDAPAPRAAQDLSRAMLMQTRGEPLRAARAFAQAASSWDQLPRPYDALLARERQAVCLLAGGRTAEGLQLLSTVYQGLADVGAVADAERTAGLLRANGETVRRPWRGGPRGYGDQLSPRELEVVALVIAGKTNREIAATLSRSPKTVAAQVRSARRKLDASSRTALAIRAVEAGLAGEDLLLARAE